MTDTTAAATRTNVVVVGTKKSMTVGLVLTILFGPLGLLYASVLGGILMVLATFVIGSATLGLGFLLGWAGSILWAIIAIPMHNARIGTKTRRAIAQTAPAEEGR